MSMPIGVSTTTLTNKTNDTGHTTLWRFATGDHSPNNNRSDDTVTALPDGGLVAWLQVVASFLLFFNCWGMVNSFGEFQVFYENDLLRHHSASQIAWIGSVQAFLLLAFTLLVGPLFDRGHGRLLVLFGSIFSSAGLIFASLSTAFATLLVTQGVITGISMSFLFVPAIAVIPLYFDSRKALAIGIGAAGSGAGGILYPIIFQTLQPVIGFAWTIRTMGFTMLLTNMIALALTHIPRQMKQTSRPLLDLGALKQYSFVAFSLACVFAFGTIYTPFFYGTTYGSKGAGMTPELSRYAVSILNGGSVVGRVVSGFCADRFGIVRTLLITTTATASLAFVWIAITTPDSFIAFCVVYGAISGSFVSLHPATISALTADKTLMGTRMGMNSVVAGFGLLIGQPLAGMVLGGLGWIGLQLFCGFGIALAAIGALATLLFLNVETDPPMIGEEKA